MVIHVEKIKDDAAKEVVNQLFKDLTGVEIDTGYQDAVFGRIREEAEKEIVTKGDRRTKHASKQLLGDVNKLEDYINSVIEKSEVTEAELSYDLSEEQQEAVNSLQTFLKELDIEWSEVSDMSAAKESELQETVKVSNKASKIGEEKAAYLAKVADAMQLRIFFPEYDYAKLGVDRDELYTHIEHVQAIVMSLTKAERDKLFLENLSNVLDSLDHIDVKSKRLSDANLKSLGQSVEQIIGKIQELYVDEKGQELERNPLGSVLGVDLRDVASLEGYPVIQDAAEVAVTALDNKKEIDLPIVQGYALVQGLMVIYDGAAGSRELEKSVSNTVRGLENHGIRGITPEMCKNSLPMIIGFMDSLTKEQLPSLKQPEISGVRTRLVDMLRGYLLALGNESAENKQSALVKQGMQPFTAEDAGNVVIFLTELSKHLQAAANLEIPDDAVAAITAAVTGTAVLLDQSDALSHLAYDDAPDLPMAIELKEEEDIVDDDDPLLNDPDLFVEPEVNKPEVSKDESIWTKIANFFVRLWESIKSFLGYGKVDSIGGPGGPGGGSHKVQPQPGISVGTAEHPEVDETVDRDRGGPKAGG